MRREVGDVLMATVGVVMKPLPSDIIGDVRVLYKLVRENDELSV